MRHDRYWVYVWFGSSAAYEGYKYASRIAIISLFLASAAFAALAVLAFGLHILDALQLSGIVLIVLLLAILAASGLWETVSIISGGQAVTFALLDFRLRVLTFDRWRNLHLERVSISLDKVRNLYAERSHEQSFDGEVEVHLDVGEDLTLPELMTQEEFEILKKKTPLEVGVSPRQIIVGMGDEE